MEKSNVYTSLKNWPCYLKKAYEDESTTIYADDFNGFSIFVYMQQGGKILIHTYSGAYPFTFRQPIKHKIAFKSTILYPFIP